MADEESHEFMERLELLARKLREEQPPPIDCDHEGWSFDRHGRRCWKCGAFVVDWGD